MNYPPSTPPIYPEDGPPPSGEDLFAGKQSADIFRRLLVMCLPPRSYGETRRFVAGYNRMVVLAWVVAPELFEGMTRVQLAGRLGISLEAFKKQVREVRAILSQNRDL